MYSGITFYSDNESNLLFDSLSEFFFSNDFKITYDGKYTLFYKVLIVIKNFESHLEIKNPQDINIPTKYKNYDSFKGFLVSKNLYHKVSYIYHDCERKETILKRDTFAIIPFYYKFLPNHYFGFSSDINQLHKLKSNQKVNNLNLQEIHNYLNWENDGRPYSSATFFNDIRNVLPGQEILVTHQKIVDNSLPERPNKVDASLNLLEAGKRVKKLFQNSILHSLNDETKIACHLSGGLDSSSIAATINHAAPHLNLHTFYIDTATDLTNEGKYAQSVANFIHSDHHVIVPPLDILDASLNQVKITGLPDFMVNGASMHRSMILNTKEKGCNIIASGHGGDAVIGYGSEYIIDYFKEGRWQELKDILHSPNYEKMGYTNRKSRRYEYYNTIYSLLSEIKSDKNKLDLFIEILSAKIFFDIPISFFAGHGLRKVKNLLYQFPATITSNFLSDTETLQRQNRIKYEGQNYLPLDPNGVFDKQPIHINEEFYLLSYHYKTKHIYPFLDYDLLQFCHSVPTKIKFDMGRRRGHMREAMRGILPEDVRMRNTKGNFGKYGRKTTLLLFEQSRDLLSTTSPIWLFVDKIKFEQSIQILYNESHELHIHNHVLLNISRALNLAIWLETMRFKGILQ